jgi:regulatory protein
MSAGPQSRRQGLGTGHDVPTPGSPAGLTPDADAESVARAVALRQLTIAPRTRAQLADALTRCRVPEEVVQVLLDRLEEVDLVDDEQYARMWVRSRHAGRGLSRRALAHELRTRGVADETVREAVGEISPDDELAAARELVRRRLPAVRGDEGARRTRRLAGMLARKGYGPGVALQAIREELAAAGIDDGGHDDGTGELGFDPDIGEECLTDGP